MANIINGKEYAWGHIKIFVNGVYVTAVKEIKYKISQEKEELQGSGFNAYAIQPKTRKKEGTLVVMNSLLNQLNVAAALQGAEDLLGVAWTIVVTYNEGLKVKVDTLMGVEFTEYEEGMTSEDSHAEHSLPFIFLSKKSI